MDIITSKINYIDDIIRNDPGILPGARKEILQQLQLLHYNIKNIIESLQEIQKKEC